MSLQALKDELIAGHPGTGAYNVNNKLAADELNVLNRIRNKNVMSGTEIFNAIDKTEFNALTDANKQLTWDIIHLGEINPFGIEASLMTDVFGGGSTTITALAAIRKENISRANELDFGLVKEGHIEVARA